MGPSFTSASQTTSEEDETSSSKTSLNGEDSDSAYHSLEDCRAESDEEQLKNAETQSECEPLAREFQTIARDILNVVYPVDPNSSSPRYRSPYTRTVVRLVNEILDKHGAVYVSIVKSIKASDSDKCLSLNVMCDELFKGEIVTWGRILALFALCYEIAHHYGRLKEARMEALFVCDFVGHYLGEKAARWVREEGGWGSLEVAFPAKDAVEKKVWRSLLVTGLSLGVLATVIKVVR